MASARHPVIESPLLLVTANPHHQKIASPMCRSPVTSRRKNGQSRTAGPAKNPTRNLTSRTQTASQVTNYPIAATRASVSQRISLSGIHQTVLHKTDQPREQTTSPPTEQTVTKRTVSRTSNPRKSLLTERLHITPVTNRWHERETNLFSVPEKNLPPANPTQKQEPPRQSRHL